MAALLNADDMGRYVEVWRTLSAMQSPLSRGRMIWRWHDVGLGLDLPAERRYTTRPGPDGELRRELLYQRDYDLHRAALELIAAGALRVEHLPNGDWVYPDAACWEALQWADGW